MIVQKILDEKPSGAIEMITAQETLASAVKKLGSLKIGALLVSDGADGVSGILSERDIVRRLAADGVAVLDSPVASAMTSKVMGCAPGDTAISVLQRMTEGRFRHMPVMEGNKLVGVISIGDVVKARMTEIEMENKAMEDMIKGF